MASEIWKHLSSREPGEGFTQVAPVMDLGVEDDLM